MSIIVDVNWKSNLAFTANVNGFEIQIDAVPEVGGTNLGPRPKPLILAALGGCTGMDVVSILNKMRVAIDGLDIKVEAEETNEHPKVYNKFHIIYHFKGKDLPLDKLEKAIQLSQDRYCGVSEMLRKTAELTFEIRMN
jgi:putative redox protein